MSPAIPSGTLYSVAIDTVARAPQSAIRRSVLGHQEAIDELAEVWETCQSSNWDGHGGLPVEQDTYRGAYQIIDTLPLGFPRPSIGAEPDGHLTLEWYKSPTRTLSVSVDPDGFLHYAGLYGSSRRHGKIVFFSSAPEELIHLVREL